MLRSAILATSTPCGSADNRTLLPIQEEVWALPLIHPTIAYVVRPVGTGPFPLAVINHGVSLNARERGFFPLVEFRDAAMWFARRGYLVVAPRVRDMAPPRSMCRNAACSPCSIQRSAAAIIRISGMRAWPSRCSTNGSSTT